MPAILKSPVPAAPSGKKATNITLSAEVLAKAREYGINISHECEAHLRSVLQRERERRWRADHVDFIAAYSRGCCRFWSRPRQR